MLVVLSAGHIADVYCFFFPAVVFLHGDKFAEKLWLLCRANDMMERKNGGYHDFDAIDAKRKRRGSLLSRASKLGKIQS